MVCCSSLFNLHPASQSIADEYLPNGRRSLFLNIGIGTPGCWGIFYHSALIRTAQKSVLIFGQNFLQNIRNWLIVEKCNQNEEKKNPSGFNVLLLLTDPPHTRRDSNPRPAAQEQEPGGFRGVPSKPPKDPEGLISNGCSRLRILCNPLKFSQNPSNSLPKLERYQNYLIEAIGALAKLSLFIGFRLAKHTKSIFTILSYRRSWRQDC